MIIRISALLLFSVAAASQASLERGSLDPAFARIPFDQWFTGGEQARIRWSAHVSQPQLSSHQRLVTEVGLKLDGADLAKRRGRGRLMIFMQIADRQGARYQDHGSIELEKLEEGIKAQEITYTQSAFVLPGDYDVSLAIYDTNTEEHSTRREKLHVTALKGDPLPDAWRNLPTVEFVTATEPPDSWYLPTLSGRLHLPIETTHPLRVDVLVNLTPSERLSGSKRIQERNLGVLLPALKTLSQAEIHNAALNVAFLDLSRRRVVFRQNNVHDLDWPQMKDSLSETNPGTIDVKSLGDRSRSAAFFVQEVSRRVAAGGESSGTNPARVVIILTSPVAFEEGEDLQPIQISGTTACPVYYFRMHPPVAALRQPMPMQMGRGRFGGMGAPMGRPPMRVMAPQLADQLESTLKPLSPRLYDIETPEQFRRAIASMLAELAQM